MQVKRQCKIRKDAFYYFVLTFKSAKQGTFESAYYKIRKEIAAEFSRHKEGLKSDRLSEKEKKEFQKLMDKEAEYDDYSGALKFLSKCLYEVTGRKAVILIDEYDVPLENAYFEGFYEKNVKFIRSLFESVLKTNEYLQFAVITGCLRISKESIFTGLNHLNIISVLDRQYSEHFGLTEPKVLDMMICAVRERIYGISFFSQAILQKQVNIFKNLRFI